MFVSQHEVKKWVLKQPSINFRSSSLSLAQIMFYEQYRFQWRGAYQQWYLREDIKYLIGWTTINLAPTFWFWLLPNGIICSNRIKGRGMMEDVISWRTTQKKCFQWKNAFPCGTESSHQLSPIHYFEWSLGHRFSSLTAPPRASPMDKAFIFSTLVIEWLPQTILQILLDSNNTTRQAFCKHGQNVSLFLICYVKKLRTTVLHWLRLLYG